MAQQTELTRSLGLKEATALVIGSIIGTGVFLKTAIMAQQTGAPVWIMLAWIIAGLLSFMGALTYAELGSLFPKAGGEYVFLREGYGRLPAFLYGWQRFWIGTPGSIAAYAVGAATFLEGVVPIGEGYTRTAIAIVMIIFFTAINCLQVSFAGKVQDWVTNLKIFMIFGLTIAIFAGSSTGSFANFNSPPGSSFPGWSAMGAAMLAALWAFDGWNNMPMAAGEIKNPGRNIPLGLLIGMSAVLVIYAITNLAYSYALPFTEVLTSNSSAHPDALPVATKAAITVFGTQGAVILSIAFVISALGAMHGSILTGARVPYAMAKDKVFFRKLGTLHPKTHVPVASVILQGVWSCALAMSGTFDQLTDYVVFASWIFYAMAAGSIIILRRNRPNVARPFKTPLYPWLSIVFVILSILLLVNTVYTSPKPSLIGLGFILAGIPAFFAFDRYKSGR